MVKKKEKMYNFFGVSMEVGKCIGLSVISCSNFHEAVIGVGNSSWGKRYVAINFTSASLSSKFLFAILIGSISIV